MVVTHREGMLAVSGGQCKVGRGMRWTHWKTGHDRVHVPDIFLDPIAEILRLTILHPE
jgi:hypothetical protein